MKSQKARAIGGWTLFIAMVSFILFSGITYQFHFNPPAWVQTTLYVLIVILFLCSLGFLYASAHLYKSEKMKLKNI